MKPGSFLTTPAPARSVSAEDSRPIAEVVILHRLDRVFHYLIPPDLQPGLEPGMRVLVPFRHERRTGIVIRLLHRSDYPRLRPILGRLDETPLLDRPMMALARWMAEYYVTGWGAALKAILPPGLDVAPVRMGRLTAKGREEFAGKSDKMNPTDRAILSALARSRREIRLDALVRRLCGVGAAGKLTRRLSLLIGGGWIETAWVFPRRRAPGTETPPVEGALPSEVLGNSTRRPPEEILEAIRAGRYKAIGLAGDTERSREIVLAAIWEVLRRGRSVILLVPEIGRVSQWQARLAPAGLQRVIIQHSGLSDIKRRRQWERIRREEAAIILGTRLAVLSPVKDPGLIVVEEEADPAYKQEESPRYHARDVAVLRASHQDAVVLLTAHAPSIETYANIQSGKYASIRAEGADARPAAPPPVRILDLTASSPRTLISDELLEAVADRLKRGDPVVLLLNRRGFATACTCRDCGFVARCLRCAVTMAYSKRSGRLSCHYCGWAMDPPTICPKCRGTHLENLGFGTEQAADLLRARFPSAAIRRLDRDTGGYEAAAELLDLLDRGKLDLLIGTELLLRGRRMRRGGLVGLLESDGAFYLPDFRAGEQTFRLISRILDFSAGSEVILQTRHPLHESIAWARTGDPNWFYGKELDSRRALGYPPYKKLAVVTIKALSEPKAGAAAGRLAEAMRRMIGPSVSAGHDLNGVEILGPASGIRPRLHGKYRFQILVKAGNPAILHRILKGGLEAVRSGPGRSGVWFEVDVDPLRIV